MWAASRGATTQYMMVPIHGRPELKTPVSLEYFSPLNRSWRELSYVPPMYEQDFFGKIVAYGRQRYVAWCPCRASNTTTWPPRAGPGSAVA